MTNFSKESFDYKIFFLCIALLCIGLVSIYSATYDSIGNSNFYKQIYWAFCGLILLFGARLLPLKWLQRSSLLLYFLSLGLLLAVLAAGKIVYGSKSWLGIGGLGIQPSEFVKITTLLAIASLLSKSESNLADTKTVLKVIGIAALPITLIMLQPDFGTSLTFIGMLLPVLYWAGISSFLLVTIILIPLVALAAIIGTTPFLIALAVCAGILYFFRENRFFATMVFGASGVAGVFAQVIYEKLPPHQQKRIAIFLDPNSDPLGAGYNVIQAKVAIGSGGLFGKGFLQGTQTQLNFIPKQWTDFIFCVPGEEFGFVGAVVVIILYALLLFHGIKLASIVKNKFGSILVIGYTSLFAFHMLVNIGMTLGLIPVVGIPLPFLSYGGSSLCSYMIMIGLMMNVYANRKEY